MKNIFKILGIALMASAMMIACGKDNEEGNDTTPDTPQPPQSSFTMTFDGTTTPIVDFQAVDHSSDGYLTVYGYATAQGDNGLYTQGFLEATPVANATYESTAGDIMRYRDPNYVWVDTDNLLGNGAGQAYWGWNTVNDSFLENVTAVDLNALTMSATWSVNIYSLEEWVANNGETAQCTMHPFTGEMINAHWTWTSK